MSLSPRFVLEGGDAVAVVQNYSSQRRHRTGGLCRRRTSAGRRGGDTVQPGGNAEARVALGALESGALSASIDDREGFRADNVRLRRARSGERRLGCRAYCVGPAVGVAVPQRALAIIDGAGGFRFKAVSASAFASLDAANARGCRCVAVLGTRGLEQRGRERLAELVRSGRGVLLTAGPDVEPAVVRQALTGVVVTTSWRDARRQRS